MAHPRDPVPRLYAESFAPWCEKARWALEHHHVPYRYLEHIPMVGEPVLRLAARRPLGRVTVPLLVDGADVIMDSFEIARRAERVGHGAPLFPEGREDEVRAWNDRSETVMTSGRPLLLARIERSPAALEEQLPAFVPDALRGAMRGVASLGVRYLRRKYGVPAGDERRHEAATRQALDDLRAELAGRRAHVLGEQLSYADIAMAASLQFVRPVDGRFISLGPATRDVWTNPQLAADYPDLLAWRDELYEMHR